MQRDITSWFKPKATIKKTETLNGDGELHHTKKTKRTARVISDDEDEEPGSSQTAAAKTPANKKKRLEKAEPKEKNKSGSIKKPSLSKLKATSPKKLKPVNPAELFGGETFRIEAEKVEPLKENAVIDLDDDEVDKSLLEVDLDESVIKQKEKKVERKRSKSKTPHKSPRKDSSTTTPNKKERADKKNLNETIAKDVAENGETTKADEKSLKKSATPKSAKRKQKEELEVDEESVKMSATPQSAKRKQKEDLESSVVSDEDRHERKRMAAMLYQKYKNRASVINPGSKEVPKGKPNCLAGLTFLITGVLESLERDEAASIIKELGGKMMTTVGKRLNYLIVGEEAGPKKLVQAEEFGVNVISEDGLLDLIREKSGDTAKQSVKKENGAESSANESEAHSSKKIKHKNEESAQDASADKKINLEKTHKKGEKDINETVTEKKNKVEKSAKKEEKHINETVLEKQIKVERSTESAEKTENSNTQNGNIAIKPKVDESMLPWVEKYKPTSVKEIVGQFGPNSNVSKLTNWLSKWYINHDGKKKLQKPNPWAKNDDGSFYKAALLSGPPGIGKTTTATLVCQELGFDTVEFNASDTRSKRLLKEEVAELLSNKSLHGYFHGQGKAPTKKHVLIMDEVDGMAGNEDRGGIQELIGLIKGSSVPIICMCNDRNHQKMRSLVNYCYDLRFSRPRAQQIKGRILSICCKEGFKIDSEKLDEIIEATNHDIRQSINFISLLSADKDVKLPQKGVGKTAEKDLKMGPWEVVRKVFSADEHKKMTFNDKCDLFFQDYSLGPLFVQQNYLQVNPTGPKSDVPRKVALAADALSFGDLIEKRIRSDSAWSLLPTQGIFSSVMPGTYMSGQFTGQINFPGWLGKYSRNNKRNRLAQELHDHTRLRTSASRMSIRLDYAPHLLAKIVRPLKERGMEGVEESLAVLKEYHLLREDIDALIELTTLPGKKSLMDAVDGRVKAALTRAYNKEAMAYSYSVTAGAKKRKAEANEEGELYGIEGGGEGDDQGGNNEQELSEQENDEIENDGLIKAKKRSTASATSKTKAAATTKTKATAGSSTTKKATTKASSSKKK